MALAPIASLSSPALAAPMFGLRGPSAVRFRGASLDTESPPPVATLAPPPAPSIDSAATAAAAQPLDTFIRQGTDINEQTGIASNLCQTLIKGYQFVTRKTPLKYLWQKNAGKCSHRTVGKNEYSCSEYGLAAFQRYNPLEAFALTSLKLLTCGPHTDETPVGALFNQPMPLKELKAQYKQLKTELPWVYWGTDEDKATFKALKSTKDAGAELPPLRPAMFDLSRLDWLRAMNYADTVKPKLYDDGVINQHLAPPSLGA